MKTAAASPAPPPSPEPTQPEVGSTPPDIPGQLRLGWALYGAGRFEDAARLLQAVRNHAPQDIEVLYLTALTFKRLGAMSEAALAFRTLLPLTAAAQDKVRGTMLRRLAVGQLNVITQGAWNLEPETWLRT